MAFLQEYTMLEELGKGGFATVYKVRHDELGYIRAIRVLNETVVDTSSNTYQKFLRECKVLLRLGNGSHPNIVHIYQPRLLDNKALVEMDYVDGLDLEHYLQRERQFIPAEEVIRMATQISSALSYCHEDIYRYCMDRDIDNLQDDPNDGSKVILDDPTRRRLIDKYKVIHNDLHSGNIMRRENGDFVLLDFGLAINGDEVVRSSRHTNGAPEFKSPEKWNDDSVLSEQSDIYSFGIVMYQYLAGMPPFPYNTSVSSHIAEYQIAEAHQNTPPPPIAKTRKDFYERKNAGKKYVKDYPEWLEVMIMKCLNKKPDDRFRNGKELHEFILQHTTKNAATPQPEPTPKAQASDPTLLSKIDALHRENTSLKQQLNDDRKTLTATQNDLQAAKTDIFKLQNIINTQSAQLKKNKKNRILHRFLLMLALTATLCCVLLIWHSASDSSRSTKELQEKLEQKQETTVPVEQQENSNSNQTP